MFKNSWDTIYSRIKVNQETDCWEWQGHLTNGYAEAYFEGKQHRLSRLFYKKYCGPIPKGLYILHSCDNPKCCNPDHLRPGTQKENMDDMYKRGRGAIGLKHKSVTCPESTPKGSRHWAAKLTESDVYKIKRLLSQGYSQRKIANLFYISRTCIERIAQGKAWKHVN